MDSNFRNKKRQRYNELQTHPVPPTKAQTTKQTNGDKQTNKQR